MKRILPLALIALVAAVPAGRAAWGWPPPGYSVTGVRACDGSQYRGLCALIRDRRHGVRPGYPLASPAPCDPTASPLQPDGEPTSPPPAWQLPASNGAPRP